MTDHPVARHLSVVIPTVGRDLLAGCLESIRSGTVWPGKVIVVDQSRNGQVDVWTEALRRVGMKVQHVRSEQTGIAAATNRGLERARSTYIAITHDDCRVAVDWVEKVARRLPEAGEAIVTGRVEPGGDGLVLTVVTHREPAVYTRPMIDRDVLFPPNMALPARLFERVGYFDEHPSLRSAGEDNEWAYRALKDGIPIRYDPDIVVTHLGWQDHTMLTSMLRRYARGQGSFYGKYLRRGDPFIIRRVLRDLIRAPWLLLRGAVTRNRELVAMGVGDVTGLFPGVLAGLRNAGNRVPMPRSRTG